MRIKVLFFTSARSDYGLLKPLIEHLGSQPFFDVSILVSGAHFAADQGMTYLEILSDGFQIDYKIDYLQSERAKNDIIYANAILQIEFNELLKANPKDLVIVLGDRSELIPVVSTAMLTGTPVAHISGGEITEGSTDNQVRHAVTKMAHLHFTSTEEYKSNILKMGEEEWRVCVSGEPGLDSISQLKYLTKKELYNSIGLDMNKPTILSTFHSETIENKINADFIEKLVSNILEINDCQILFTAANVDFGGEEINEIINVLSHKYSNVYYVKSLGKLKYYSMMKYANVMLGNSSSGIVEAKSFNLPVINVGERQKGRLRNDNVIDVDVNQDLIVDKISLMLNLIDSDKLNKTNVYGSGNACSKISSFLQNVDFNKLNLKKSTFN